MQTLAISKLIEFFNTSKKKPAFYLILSDEAIVKHLALESLARQQQGSPAIFSGKNAIEQMAESAAMGSLFSPHPPSLIELEPKLTEKQWNTCGKSMDRMPQPREFLAYFLGSTAQRNIFNEVKYFTEVILSWSPNELEAQKSLKELLKKYKFAKSYNQDQIDKLISLSLDYYSLDLLACDAHFYRMEKTQSTFEDSLLSQTEIKSFHVVDALASGNGALVELRVQQCMTSGEEPGAILKAIAAFFRQLLDVKSGFEKTKNVDAVLKNLEIRQPLQQIRLKKALQNISTEKIAAFFFHSATLEMNLRTAKNPYNWLAQELLGLVNPRKSL